MPKYPEHVKLGRVKDKSQACDEFLTWLLQKKGFTLAKYHKHTDACWPEGEDYGTPGCHADNRRICGMSEGVLYPESAVVTKLVAEFYNIDEAKLAREKEAILDEHREVVGIKKVAT